MAQPQVVESVGEIEVALGKIVCISVALTITLRDSLVKFLAKHHTAFAWSHSDMEGIDLEIIAHQLSILPDAEPIWQKRRNFAPECNQAIAKKVSKLLAANFIREIHYPD